MREGQLSAVAFASGVLAVLVAAKQPVPASTTPRVVAPEEVILLGRDFRNPNDVLNDFHDAAAKADLERYFQHWTPISVFLGTDATERWTGDAFRTFAQPIFEKGTGWTYKPRDRKIQQLEDGKLAYFDELLENSKLGVCRGSGVLILMDGNWKILQYNLSIPIPNEKALEVVRVIREK